MKLSTKGRYAARAMLELARNNSEMPLQIKEIAHRQDISVKYLERIMSRMAAAGLVISLRGLHGGFRLAKPPDEIQLMDILTAADESITPVDCATAKGCCGNEADCVMSRVWAGLHENMKDYLTAISLQDLISMNLQKHQI